MNIITISVLCLLFKLLESRYIDSYSNRRNCLLEEERLLALGGKIILTQDEEDANNVLMQLKRKEIEESFLNPERFNFSKHYFTYKEYMETSKVYQIIKKMPKGAALHVHSSYMLDANGLLELTYEDHLYACYQNDLKLLFSDRMPTLPCPVEWTLLSELRNNSDNVTLFDKDLKKHFSLVSDDKIFMNAGINEVWEKFEDIHKTMGPLLSYRPVREKYIYKSLEKFYADNVMYIEIRTGLSNLYDLDGTKYDKMYMVKLYRDVMDKFIKDHPDFIGFKIIVTAYRAATPEKVQEIIDIAKIFKSQMPEMFAGFDLVGQEDLGRPLKDFVPIVEKAKADLDFYFHAGETLWFGSETDENLIDAILLGSKRIGHAYALLKHPSLIKLVVKKDIAIEVNVISNAVLTLVRDLRNHPLASYLALGMPVVLSSDDPSAWGSEPLTHDFYVAFVTVASKNYDLRMLKQLSLNSIKYSALDTQGKEKCLKIFNDKWQDFVSDLKSVKIDSLPLQPTRNQHLANCRLATGD